ncbi:MAG: histidine--tRNA ligase [Dehalococcoidia bacterium]
MRDTTEDSWQRLQGAQERLRRGFALYGYQVIDTPLLEPTELFVRKSGGELATQMYTFSDPSGQRVSLRPEFTSSIMRHFLDGRRRRATPLRVQYAGPVLRYQAGDSVPHQFTQVGAELLGSSSPSADAEILGLAWEGLASLGLRGHRLVLGDVGVHGQLLAAQGLSERAGSFILNELARSREGTQGTAGLQERAQRLRLLAEDGRQESLRAVVQRLSDRAARRLLRELFQEVERGPWGSRPPEEIVDRLLRKLRSGDSPAQVKEGLELASSLARVKGEPGQALAQAEEIIAARGLDPGALQRLKSVMALLEEHPAPRVTLDFGLARGLAYYTGIVFEIEYTGIALGGGGRYDGLAQALGSRRDVPALGFAYHLERVVEALGRRRGAARRVRRRSWPVLVVPREAGAQGPALRLAAQLRLQETSVELGINERNLEQSLAYARQRGMARVIVVESDGTTTSHSIKGR